MLHIINRSPTESAALSSCLRYAQAGHAILFIANGVLATLDNCKDTIALIKTALTQQDLYALEPDLIARGVLSRVLPGIKLIDYAGFVALTVQHQPIQNWS